MKNIYAEVFKKNKERIQVIADTDGVETNVLYNPKSDEILAELEHVCVDVFENNKNLMKKRSRIKRLKFFLIYGIPVIGFMTAANFIFKTPAKTKKVPVYTLEETVLSEDKMSSSIDESLYCAASDYDVEDDIVNVKNVDTLIQFQMRNEKINILVTLNVSDDGQLKFDSFETFNVYNVQPLVLSFDAFTEVDDKYKGIEDVVIRFIDNSNKIDGDFKKVFWEVLEMEGTEKVTTVFEYYYKYDVDAYQSDSSRNTRNIAELMGCLSMSSAYICFFNNRNKTRKLMVLPDGTIEESDDKTLAREFYGHDHLIRRDAEAIRSCHIKSLVRKHLTDESQKYFDVSDI